MITLNLAPESSLNWEHLPKSGFFVFDVPWERVKEPLFEKNIAMAIGHFLDTKDWSEGVALYRGPIPENIEFFADLWMRLHALFPEEVDVFALFAPSQEDKCLTLARKLSQEYFPNLKVALCGAQCPITPYRWDETGVSYRDLGVRAICLPLERVWTKVLLADFERFLTDFPMPYKILSELYLTEMWDGLDEILYHPEAITAEGKRKLQGFAAAGGEVTAMQ